MKKAIPKIVHATISPCQDERRIFNEALSASRAGYLVEIYALKVPEVEEITLLSGVVIRRISIKFWKGGPLKFIIFNWRLSWKLIKEDFDILHLHDLWVLPAGALISFFKNCKVVYDAHEFARGLEIFQKKQLSGRIWAITEKILIKRVDVILTINSFHQKLFSETYKKISTPEIIFNFPSLGRKYFKDRLPQFRERRNAVLYQGIFKNHRGLKQLLEAMTVVKSGYLDLVGFGEIEPELNQMVKLLNIDKIVRFKGRVSWDQLLNETCNAKIGIVLFEPEGLNYQYASPNKFFEYVMAGTPVIASNIATFKEYLSIYEVGILVNIESIEEIAQAIKRLLTDEKKWTYHHLNCLKAREHWNWETQEHKLINIYKECIFES